MPRSPVCVDANIVVMIVAPEAQRPQAIALWNSWLEQDREIVAPRLLAYEVTSALWRKVVRGFLTIEEGQRAVRAALEMGVIFIDPPTLSERAFELAADNPVIEEELRRIYGQRDGIEPHRVQLTRGALARLYLKGDLLPRAISELLSLIHI